MALSAKPRCLVSIKKVQGLSQATNIVVPALPLSSYVNRRDGYKSYLTG